MRSLIILTLLFFAVGCATAGKNISDMSDDELVSRYQDASSNQSYSENETGSSTFFQSGEEVEADKEKVRDADQKVRELREEMKRRGIGIPY